MTCSTWAANMQETAGDMLSKLSNKLARFACGLQPSAAATAAHDDHYEPRNTWLVELSSALLFSPGSDDEDVGSSSSHASSSARSAEEQPAEDTAAALPCVAFPSQHGYMVFSLAEGRVTARGLLRPAPGRRLVPSPYGGGAVLATELSSCRHPSRLVDPLTGGSAPLPDLPVPLGDRGPGPCEPEEPRVQGRRRAAEPTDDGFAWDLSPRGVMVARGDTAFFCATPRGGVGGEWTPVCRSTPGSFSTMTVNYRGGLFFLLEQRTLLTRVIDAWTLEKVAEIAPPAGDDDDDGAFDRAHLVASTDDVLLLVQLAGDTHCKLFSKVYRARHKKPSPEWAEVADIGDRALFVDRLHGFTVGTAGGGENAAGVRRNCVYGISVTPVDDPLGRRVAVYNVVEFDVRRPEVGETLESQLGGFQVEQIWGEPYWTIPNHTGSMGGNSIVSSHSQ